MPAFHVSSRILLAVSIAAAAVALPGCKSGAGDTNQSDAGGGVHAPDYTGQWTLRTIGTDEIAATLPDGAPAPFLMIAGDGGVTGNAGVNRLSSRFDAGATARGEPLFGPVVTTKMAGPEPLMSLESGFTRALGEARSASIEGGNLELYDAAGVRLAVLTPAR